MIVDGALSAGSIVTVNNRISPVLCIGAIVNAPEENMRFEICVVCRKNILTGSVVLLYTKQLAPEDVTEVRQKNLPMMNTNIRDHKMKWQPAVAVCGLGLIRSFTGLFAGEYLERKSATVVRQ
jgi:hypothetical protein